MRASSYCCGSAEDNHPILLNGQRHDVTKNLESALRRLRYVGGPRSLWIDALCINQSDLTERGQQVFIIDYIYGNTKQGLFWLREEPEEPQSTVSKEQA